MFLFQVPQILRVEAGEGRFGSVISSGGLHAHTALTLRVTPATLGMFLGFGMPITHIALSLNASQFCHLIPSRSLLTLRNHWTY